MRSEEVASLGKRGADRRDIAVDAPTTIKAGRDAQCPLSPESLANVQNVSRPGDELVAGGPLVKPDRCAQAGDKAC